MGPADPAQIVVDMSEVEFCDSTGMNVLLAAPFAGLASVFTVQDDLGPLNGQ
jgi:anti-anti-sigma regulatory factor